MANEYHYPEEIIHHIQYFLDAKELAQTSILSKSWFAAWSTRPVLVFDENNFLSPREHVFSHEFSKFCTETLNRYETLNLKVHKFMLLMKIGQEFAPGWGMTQYEFSLRNKLAGELITSASKLGVTEIELKLNYCVNYLLWYDLPAQVFASTSLTRLSVARYAIHGVIGDRVLCSCLKFLVLNNVKTNDDVVRDILVGCPLIENLDLCHCIGIGTLNVSKLINLRGFRIVKGLMVSVEFIDLDGMNVTEFRCLRRLQLENVRIGAEFFTRFGCMFPCVEDLILGYWGEYEEINISSRSVKRLSLKLSSHEWEMLKKVQLTVPNISKFVYKAGRNDFDTQRNQFKSYRNRFKPLPSLSFDNVSRDWESNVELFWRCDVIEACWFVDLRNFLIQLNPSRISLRVMFNGKSMNPGEEIPCLLPEVEKLRVCTCLARNTTESLLLGLSGICRPNLITKCRECRC